MNANKLKLNCEKTEFIVFHPRHSKLQVTDFNIRSDESVISPASQVKNLGVIQDSCLTMEKHINNVVRACYYHIRNIGKIRKNITTDSTRTLVKASVTSRLDYANALLYGLPSTLLDRLQVVQNTSARLITRTPRRDHITPILMQLHWLPIQQRLSYKILLYAYKAIRGNAPSYICDMVEVYQPRRALRSASKSLLVVPRIRTISYGERTFRSAVANLWKSLPETVKNADSLNLFKTMLKTHLFRFAFRDYL